MVRLLSSLVFPLIFGKELIIMLRILYLMLMQKKKLTVWNSYLHKIVEGFIFFNRKLSFAISMFV